MASDTIAGLDALDLAAGSRKGTAGKALRSLWPKLAAVALVLAVWELLYLAHWKHYVFPGPGQTLGDLADQAGGGQLWQAIATTLTRAAGGYALAVVVGSVVGALVSRIPSARAALGSLITGMQTMPSIAWFPFAIILFGPSTSAIGFVVVMAAAPSIANGLIAGVDYTPPLLVKAARAMGLRGPGLYRHLFAPASLPAYVAGLKQGWAFAWHGLLTGELIVVIANQPSIGVLLSSDQSQTDMPSTIAVMIVILMLGIGADGLFGLANVRIRRGRGLA